MSPAASWALMAGVFVVSWLAVRWVLIPLILAGSQTSVVRRSDAWADVDARFEEEQTDAGF